MRRSKITILTTLIASVFAMQTLSHKSSVSAHADGDWQVINTKVLPTTTLYTFDFSQAYIYFNFSVNDYSNAPASFVDMQTQSNFNLSDYNFLSYIQLSNDNVNYVPFSTVSHPSHVGYMFQNGKLWLDFRLNSETTPSDTSYQYIKILEGCEFPSYDYCANGGTKKKYVQQSTTLSKLSSTSDNPTYNCRTATYTEEQPKTPVTFTGIANGWNNSCYGTNPKYREVILSFGIPGTDFLAHDHVANATNRATNAYDIGNKLTIDGVPVYKIYNKLSGTTVSYTHGNCFLYFSYPVEIFQMNKNNPVVTLHIEAGTEFMDSILPEVTMKFVGGSWIITTASEFRLDEPLDFFYHSMVKWPHHFGTKAHAVLYEVPEEGSQIGFVINTGNIDLNDSSNRIIFDGLYNCSVTITPSSGTIQLSDSSNSNTVVQQFDGYMFTPNTDYLFEFDISCGTNTTFKFAINHYLLINYTFNTNKAIECALWVYDSSDCFSMDMYEEVGGYKPIINYSGSSSYDFIEGDPVYNFASLVDAFDLYNDLVHNTYVQYIYDDGAVTAGRYNAGIWNLNIVLSVNGYKPVVKTITINVHGDPSIAKIYYDDGDPIEVPIGSKLVPPRSPDTYRENGYDYVFEGWYFEGAKWDFENDTVQGDMHLYSRFIATAPHYVVTAIMEGITRNNERYSLTAGSELPFDLFEVEGATFEVFLGGNKITSLIVNSDVTITVRYTVVFTYIEPKEPTYTQEGNIGYWYSPVYEGYYFADQYGRELLEDAIIPKLKHMVIDEVGDYDYLLFTPSDYSLPGNDTNPFYGNVGDIFQDSFCFQFKVNIPSANLATTTNKIAFGATNIYGASPIYQFYLNDSTYRFGMFFGNSYDWISYASSPEWTGDEDHVVEFYAIKTDSTHMKFLMGFDGELIWKTNAYDISGVDYTGHTYVFFTNTGSTKSASYFSSASTIDTALDRFGERKLSSKEVSFSDNSNTVACLTKYPEAKAFYNKYLTNTQKIAFCTDAKYANLKDRFVAWGHANGESVAFDSQGRLLINKILPMQYVKSSNWYVIVLIISLTSISLVSVFLLYKKRKTKNTNVSK